MLVVDVQVNPALDKEPQLMFQQHRKIINSTSWVNNLIKHHKARILAQIYSFMRLEHNQHR